MPAPSLGTREVGKTLEAGAPGKPSEDPRVAAVMEEGRELGARCSEKHPTHYGRGLVRFSVRTQLPHLELIALSKAT